MHVSILAGCLVSLLASWQSGPVSPGKPGVKAHIATQAGREGAREREALRAAFSLLPQTPQRLVVVDVTRFEGKVRDYLLRFDAFTLTEDTTVYVVRQSRLLKGATSGSSLLRAMLAAVIWHEMAHLSGADETGARRSEESLWTRFVRDGLTDPVTGLRYLQALRARPDDVLQGVTRDAVIASWLGAQPESIRSRSSDRTKR
jgi:hypothetical protein